MKKKLMKIWKMPAAVLLSSILFVLSGCGGSYEKSIWYAQSVEIDGELCELSLLYPGGCVLTLISDGTGSLNIDNLCCSLSWTGDESTVNLNIGGEQSRGEYNDSGLTLDMSGTGMLIHFSDSQPEEAQSTSASELIETQMQSRYNGFYSGSIEFSDCAGSWIDYEHRNMEVTAELSLSADGGEFSLLCDFFSSKYPLLESMLTVMDDNTLSVQSGYFLDDTLETGDIQPLLMSDENGTRIMISGSYRKGPDQFDYYIEVNKDE